MDLGNLMQMAGQLKDKLGAAQAEAQRLQVVGEAGGGLVEVTMNGRHEVLRVKIEATHLGQPADVKLLEDLLRAAINQATAKVQSGLKDRLGGLARDFGVDVGALEGMLPR